MDHAASVWINTLEIQRIMKNYEWRVYLNRYNGAESSQLGEVSDRWAGNAAI